MSKCRTILFSCLCLGSHALQATDTSEPPVVRWEAPGISGPQWESHPAFDPLTGDIWFVRSDATFSGWRILTSHCNGQRWSEPREMAFAGRGIEADPFFTAGGRTMYFISSRRSGSPKSSALDIWRVRRNANGQWQSPERLPAPVNSDEAEWFPRPAPDGWLYFGSGREGGRGKDDIWRARRDVRGRWRVEHVGGDLNSPGAEYELLPSPDGSWGILSTDAGLLRVRHDSNGWHRGARLPASINANATEIGPALSPTGRTLLFSRDAGAGLSGELFLARLGQSDDWPPHCGAGAMTQSAR